MTLTHAIASAPVARRGGSRLHAELARRIGTGIVDGTYQPGTLLPNEAEWGARFGASRTVVREAMKTLAGKGLIVPRPRVGSRVEPRERWNLLDRDVLAWHSAVSNSHELLRAIQDVRRIVEPGAAELAASRRSTKQLTAIATALDGMTRAETAGQLIEADVRFHLALLSAANNELLTPFGIAIEQALWQLHQYSVLHNPRPQHVFTLHRSVYLAVVAGDGHAARQGMLAILCETDQIIQPPESNGKLRKARSRN